MALAAPICGRAESLCRRGSGSADFRDFIPYILNAGCQHCGIACAADMHEINLRLVEEEMIVKRRHFEPAVEGRAHGRVHLVLKQHIIPHDHRAAMGRWRERGPGAKAHKGRHGPAVHLYLYVTPRFAGLKDIFLRDHRPLHANDLLNLCSVQSGLRE